MQSQAGETALDRRSTVVEKEQVPARKSGRRWSVGLAPIAGAALALYVAFLLYPIVQSVLWSLTDKNPLKAGASFVGLDNYQALLHDSDLLASLRFTVIVVVAVTVLSNAIGIGFAVVLNKSTRNFRLMRTFVFIPQVLSGVIVAFIWRSILSQDGLLNRVLDSLGLVKEPVQWIGTPQLATLSIVTMATWMTVAFTTVVYTASLQSVPPELYEAAKIDGAGVWARFRAVTFPMIAPGMTISVVLCLITTLKMYDLIAVLTAGGPANSTRSTAYYLIQVAFTENRFGYASSIANGLLVVTAVIAYGMTSLLRRREVDL